MRIRTNLLLLCVSFVISIVIIGFMMFYTFALINKGVADGHSANEIAKDIAELNIITYEYMMHYERRMGQQWRLKYNSLGKHLKSMRRKELRPEHLSILEKIITDYKALGSLFIQLQDNIANKEKLIREDRPQPEINLAIGLEQRLLGQSLMRSQKITTEAFNYSGMIERMIVQTQQKANLLVLFSIIAFAIFSTCISFFTVKSITRPINELVKGTEVIGKGDLGHKIVVKTKNEMGQLSGAFNQMASDLKKSRDQLEVYSMGLEKEVEERTRELREAQEKVIRSERLAALGKLAGAVGHELRNPLGIIRNSVYFLGMRLGRTLQDEKIKRHLKILDMQVDKSDGIIADILTFGRVKGPILANVDINDVVKDSLSKIWLPENIEVLIQLKRDLPGILADKGQLQLVFSNVISNAAQAMPEGGRLTIKGVKKNESVDVDITDTGEGISKEDLARVFEPFFSNRVQGTGLGLCICQSIIEKHNGTIGLESKVGKGTKVIIRLPIKKDM